MVRFTNAVDENPKEPVFMHIQICTYKFKYIYIYIYTHTDIHIYIYIYIYIHIYIHIYIYIYLYIHTHTHIYIYIYIPTPLPTFVDGGRVTLLDCWQRVARKPFAAHGLVFVCEE